MCSCGRLLVEPDRCVVTGTTVAVAATAAADVDRR